MKGSWFLRFSILVVWVVVFISSHENRGLTKVSFLSAKENSDDQVTASKESASNQNDETVKIRELLLEKKYNDALFLLEKEKMQGNVKEQKSIRTEIAIYAHLKDEKKSFSIALDYIKQNPNNLDISWICLVFACRIEEYPTAIEITTRFIKEKNTLDTNFYLSLIAWRASCHAILGDIESAMDDSKIFRQEQREMMNYITLDSDIYKTAIGLIEQVDKLCQNPDKWRIVRIAPDAESPSASEKTGKVSLGNFDVLFRLEPSDNNGLDELLCWRENLCYRFDSCLLRQR